jgi:hypothetical protein
MNESILIVFFGLMLGVAFAFNLNKPVANIEYITNIDYETYNVEINFSNTPTIEVIDAKSNIYIWTYDKEEFNYSNGLLFPLNYSDNTEKAYITYTRVK